MMEINSLTTQLLISLRKIKNERQGGGDCYLFGSALTQNNPRDIDLLLVYDYDKIDLTSVLILKKKLCRVLGEDLGKNIDLCSLSKSESIQSSFIVEENCQFLISL
ncbi:MAG: hypothetical protein IH589_11285 [Anaerolineales bacterium]|nr:hypothetical protein [Anaerolineales bacterium]